MKKLFLIGLGFVLAVAVFGVAGFAYAQTQEPPEDPGSASPEFPYGRGGWSRGARGGMMGQGAVWPKCHDWSKGHTVGAHITHIALQFPGQFAFGDSCS